MGGWAAYHVLDVEAVLCEAENETGLTDALVAQEDNLVLHLAGLVGHFKLNN